MGRLVGLTILGATALPTWVSAQVPLLTDRFDAYGAGQLLDLEWQVQSGSWAVRDGRLVGSCRDRGVCWTSASPATADQRIEVLVTPHARQAPGGWAAAALAVWSSGSNHWRLAVVEGPEGRRYAELLEMRNDHWQAQSEGGTALGQLPNGVDGFEWETDHTYRYRLTLRPDQIVGEITDDATGDLLFRRGFALPPGADAVRSGRPALVVDSLEAAFDDLRVTGNVVPAAGERSRRGDEVAILDTGTGDAPRQFLAEMRKTFTAAGVACEDLGGERLAAAGEVPPEVGLLVLPHTRRLPLGTVALVDRFLRAGGRAVFFGGPYGEEQLVKRGNRWLPLAEALAETPTGRIFADFGRDPIEAWFRGHGPGESNLTRAVEPGPPGAGKALHVEVDQLHGWDTLGRAFDVSPFEGNEALTCFWAKGGPKTTHLALEWQEKDGSRWMTSVPLSTTWRRYVLAPDDFRYWADSKSVGRGGQGDRFRPENAALFAFGLAQSHAPLGEGAHAYWIADVGTASMPFAVSPAPTPIMEAVSPTYKTYVPTAASDLAAAPDQLVAPTDLRLPAPSGLRCAMPRTRGLGLRKARFGRWVPVLTARDAKGQWRGVAALIYLSFADPYTNAAWGVVGTEDGAYLQGHWNTLGPVVLAMGRTLLGGVHLVKAGSDEFSYFPEETPILGGQVSNLSSAPQELTLSVTVRPMGREAVLFRQSWAISALPGVATGASGPWSKPAEPGVYVVRTELRRGQEMLDVSSQEFVRLAKPAAAAADFVRRQGDDFRLGDQRWHPHGINFWPSNATALEPASYWLHWLDPTNYDPDVIDRDVAALADLKLNSVSIALGSLDQLPALNHFLFRLAEKGIKANVHVGGAYPTAFDVNRPIELIRAGRLADNPAIWAWDIAWEPHLGDYQARTQLDAKWAAWIAERYGTAENAEKDWGVPVPRKPDGSVTGPSDEQVTNDGSHRVVVAAYRRFVDDLISATYGEWARRVREVDPRHLIGVRSGYGGTGQPWVDGVMAYDLVSGAKHLDFISPEGYGLGGGWENFERGAFTTAYGRYAGGGKPVFWAEFGMSVYPQYTPEQLEAQRLLYQHMYRMALWSGASGSAGWWFPGGYRVDEKSDYGFMNPDGTPRPSALEARRWSPKFAEQRAFPDADYWITIDRDLHPRGYSQVWARHGDEYVAARRAGRFVGLRTEGTGTDSTNVLLIAIGNVPANGTNPPKYLNGEFNSIRVRAGGEWTEVTPGTVAEVPRNRPVELAVSVGNTGEATWLSPARVGTKPGGVCLISAPGTAIKVRQPIAGDVPRYGDAMIGPFVLTEKLDGEVTIVLGLVAEGRTPFGQKVTFTLRPR